MLTDRRILVCAPQALREGQHLRVEILYADVPSSVLVFRLDGQALAYRNLCVHMPRELDCEKNTIFDASGRHLRCSMHGIVYDPHSGASISTMCNGERLTPVRIVEDEDGIWIRDKRVKPLVHSG